MDQSSRDLTESLVAQPPDVSPERARDSHKWRPLGLLLIAWGIARLCGVVTPPTDAVSKELMYILMGVFWVLMGIKWTLPDAARIGQLAWRAAAVVCLVNLGIAIGHCTSP